MKEPKKRIVGYVRVSTSKQRDEGVSLAAQHRKIRMYAEMYELDLVSIEVDVASGKNIHKRPALKKCLKMLSEDQVDGMLIMKLDRLTRRVKDVCFLVEDYFQEKILISVNDQIDTQTPTGILMLNILTTFAQWERQVLSQRTCEAMGFLKENGVSLGRLPFGLMYSGELGENRRKMIVKNDHEQLAIKRMSDLRDSGLTLQSVCDVLENEGYTTKRGGKWQPCTVNKILQREVKLKRLEDDQIKKDYYDAIKQSLDSPQAVS